MTLMEKCVLGVHERQHLEHTKKIIGSLSLSCFNSCIPDGANGTEKQ